MIPQIGLRIGGTKERRAGFAPLVTVGVLAGNEGDNMDRSSLIADNPSYLVKHGDGYIMYMMLDIRVKSFDADASGVLSIAITIPSNQCLADGKSPYTLLQDIYNLFVANYMAPQTDGRHSFINKEIDDEPFRQIVSQYSLVPSAYAYIKMNPNGLTGTLNVPADKMADFMRDTQFPEFASYKEIEIGALCKNSIGLENLEIPRVHTYNIIVNGTPTGQALRNPEDKYTTALESTSMVEYTNVSFSLGRLLAAAGQQMSFEGANVRLDPMTETIHCTIPKRIVKYTVKVVLKRSGSKDLQTEDKNAIINLLKSGKIHLLISGKDISDIIASPISDPYQIDASIATGEAKLMPSRCGDYYFSVTSQTDKSKHDVAITISYQKSSAASATPHSRPTSPKPVSPEMPAAPAAAPETAAGYSRKSLIISALVGFACGCLLVGCLWWLLGNNEPSNTPSGDDDVVYGDTLSANQNDSTKAMSAGTLDLSPDDNPATAPEPTTPETDEAKRVEKVEDEMNKAEEAAKKKKAEEEEAKKKQQEEAKKAQDRAEILALLNKSDLQGCRNHTGWKSKSAVSKSEQNAIENILKKRDELKATKLENEVLSKYKPFTWDNISKASKAISEWESKPENN
ncbi:MAG: hypothetical protein K6F94_09440 [Bacteroidaceae bacterium]|nr:hypothetical protein [Bacteroidaceae bacterium]